MVQIKSSHEKFRFIIVGGLNTLIDFTIYFLLGLLEIAPIAANYASTSIALLFSFTANRRFTFKQFDRPTRKQVVLFIVLTLCGLWVLQPVIIWLTFHVLSPGDLNSPLILVLSKLFATGSTLVWNYQWYSKVVFKVRSSPN